MLLPDTDVRRERGKFLNPIPLLLLAAALTGTVAAQEQKAPAPPGRLVNVGHYRVHLYCTGQGSPAVILAGGFSFDWALVQSRISQFTEVCSFDASGTAWSDPFSSGVNDTRPPTCLDRVEELHQLLVKAPVKGPYILVGFSIGGLWARLYALAFPRDIKGVVLVDHAFLGPDPEGATAASSSPTATKMAPNDDSPPVLISMTPITLGFEDDENFRKLPELDQKLHHWAMSEHPLRPTAEMAVDCFRVVDAQREGRGYPLGDMPLDVISTENHAPGYAELQEALLALSRRSKHVVAHGSSHMVPIDAPEVIVKAVEEMLAQGH